MILVPIVVLVPQPTLDIVNEGVEKSRDNEAVQKVLDGHPGWTAQMLIAGRLLSAALEGPVEAERSEEA